MADKMNLLAYTLNEIILKNLKIKIPFISRLEPTLKGIGHLNIYDT